MAIDCPGFEKNGWLRGRTTSRVSSSSQRPSQASARAIPPGCPALGLDQDMLLAIKDATVLKLTTKLPVKNARGTDLVKVLNAFDALLKEYEYNLPAGIKGEPTQRLGADGAPLLVVLLVFWTKEDAEAALQLDEGDGICSPIIHAHLESTNGSRRGKYLVHGPALVGLDNEHIHRLLCRIPRVSAAKVEPAFLYDDGPLRADAAVATITHTGQLERCFTVSGFQQAVWLDRKVPHMPIVEMPPAGSSQPLPTRPLPATAQWASKRPQQQEGEQSRRERTEAEARRDQQQPAEQRPPQEPAVQEDQSQQPRREQRGVAVGDASVLSPDLLAAQEQPPPSSLHGSPPATSLGSGTRDGPEQMDYTRGQPKRPTGLAPPAEDEGPPKAARASTSSSPLPARRDDATSSGGASSSLLLLQPSIKEEEVEEKDRRVLTLAVVPSASVTGEERAALEYRRVKAAREGLLGGRKLKPEEMRHLHALSSVLQVRIKDSFFLRVVAEHFGVVGNL
jgi:hypothetical protein